ncbi:MAG: SDR family oxidoreductase [Pseudomonadota bacterium]
MHDKVLFITGASSGIGMATARAASAAGWRVALMARRGDVLADLCDELGGVSTALPLPGDASDLSQQNRAMDEAARSFGGIDAVFANAGMGVDAPGVENGDPEEWDRLIRINIMGVLWSAKAALPHLKRSGGHLLLTGSAAGRVHIRGSVYGATKWFVHGLAGNLAEEMREWGGRCTLVAPGMVDTPFFETPKPTKLQPDDIAEAVVFALSQPKRADVREIFVMPTD